MFYAWRCKKSTKHWVITDKKDISFILGKVCPQCKSVLEFEKEFPDDDQRRVGFDCKQAREDIKAKGYYVRNSIISITEKSIERV